MATTAGDPYALRFPQDGDIADVPQDIKNLSLDVTAGLNRKLEQGPADIRYQRKIAIKTAVPSDPTGYNEGDIIFVIPE